MSGALLAVIILLILAVAIVSFDIWVVSTDKLAYI